jgi:hypothetical protein
LQLVHEATKGCRLITLLSVCSANPPQLSDLNGFAFDNDEMKSVKNCKPGDNDWVFASPAKLGCLPGSNPWV